MPGPVAEPPRARTGPRPRPSPTRPPAGPRPAGRSRRPSPVSVRRWWGWRPTWPTRDPRSRPRRPRPRPRRCTPVPPCSLPRAPIVTGTGVPLKGGRLAGSRLSRVGGHAPRGPASPDHRCADAAEHRLRRGPPRSGGGRRSAPDGVRPGAVDHREERQAAPDAPEDALGGRFLETPWESAATAIRASAYSLKELVVANRDPLREGRGSVVSLDFDATVAWPAYDWMGASKAALESVTRYLARDLGGEGIRVNCVAAGPLRTVAARGIPGFDAFIDRWERRAPLGWDPTDPAPVADACVWLLSSRSAGQMGRGGPLPAGAALVRAACPPKLPPVRGGVAPRPATTAAPASPLP